MEISLIPNERSIHSISFPSETQALYWKLRRSNASISYIAKSFNKSLPYVSKTLRITNKKIKTIIEDTARVNLVKIERISSEIGFAIGFSPALIRKAYITFSPSTGSHIWYEHTGDCFTCPGQSNCQSLLTKEAADRNIAFPADLVRETEKADYLFNFLMEYLKWI
ncbi:MAG: hypothetical protein ACXAC7_00200 [Candidatus Hodarchaeales archaeon]|jgi:hypothetical protein